MCNFLEVKEFVGCSGATKLYFFYISFLLYPIVVNWYNHETMSCCSSISNGGNIDLFYCTLCRSDNSYWVKVCFTIKGRWTTCFEGEIFRIWWIQRACWIGSSIISRNIRYPNEFSYMFVVWCLPFVFGL